MKDKKVLRWILSLFRKKKIYVIYLRCIQIIMGISNVGYAFFFRGIIDTASNSDFTSLQYLFNSAVNITDRIKFRYPLFKGIPILLLRIALKEICIHPYYRRVMRMSAVSILENG